MSCPSRFEVDDSITMRRVTQRLVEITAEVDDIRTERELNRLTDDAAMALVADLLDAVRGLAERDSPAISRELDDEYYRPRLAGAGRLF